MGNDIKQTEAALNQWQCCFRLDYISSRQLLSLFAFAIMFSRHLSVLTDYYVRKLIRRYSGQLKSVVAQGASIAVDTQTSIDLVLDSLYLEPQEVVAQARELEVLVRYHQELDQKYAKPITQLQDLEQKIFWVVGLRVMELAEAPSTRELVSRRVSGQLFVAA